MSSLNFKCPPSASIPAIPKVTCPEKFGQIQRIALRRTPDPADVSPIFAVMADIIDQSKWVAALALSTNEKIQVTPFISSHVIPPGTAISEEGGNNNTVNGISILEGTSNVIVTGRFLNLPNAIATILRLYSGDSALTPGFTNLEAAFFNEFGQIIHKKDAAGTVPLFIPLYNWFVGTVGSEGLNKSNVTPMQYELAGDWDTNLVVSTPTWDPRSL